MDSDELLNWLDELLIALHGMATACAAGDQAATARAAGQYMVAVGALSNTPGIGG